MKNVHIHNIFGAPPKNKTLRTMLTCIVLEAARNPDKGSDFDLATRDIRTLCDREFRYALISRGYECLVAEANGCFLGLVGYQRHKDGSWHSFAYHVPEQMQGQGVGKILVRALINAGFRAGVTRMRIYGGNVRRELSDKNDKTMQHLYEDVILGNALGLEFEIERGHDIGWIRLRNDSAIAHSA